MNKMTGTPGAGGQRGITLIGLVLILGLIGFFAVIVMKTVPSYVEYKAIVTQVHHAAGAASAQEAKVMFNRNSITADITSITADDLEIVRDNGALIVNFAYTKKIPLFGPVSLTIDYAGSSRDR